MSKSVGNQREINNIHDSITKGISQASPKGIKGIIVISNSEK